MLTAICLCSSSCSSDFAKAQFNENAIETDSSLSKITESDAVEIAIDGSAEFVSQYDTYDASYYSDGTWRVSFHNQPITCGGGVMVVIDEESKEVIDVIEQE